MDTAFEELLKQAMGLDAASLGSFAVERAVRSRLRQCGSADVSSYLERVRTSPAELQHLIEALVVPETWFFRDPEAFALLARWALADWLPRNPEGLLSVLSLPCSTGEEPFSIAMSLLTAGFPASRFRIDAVDISARALAVGERAVYGKNSFRGEDLAFRASYFDSYAAGWQLRAAVRHQVQFQRSNLLAADFLPGVGLYDAIFCRNVLIYFDRSTQDRAIQVVMRLLAAKGLLFVAPSETALVVSHDFSAVRAPMAFAFQRRDPRLGVSKAPVPAPPTSSVRGPPIRRAEPAQMKRSRTTHADDLDQAASLADAGRFAEATTLCEAHLKTYGPTAPAYRLVALIRAATGHIEEAIASYRKALYLSPDDHEALIHLGLLLEKRGDAIGATALRQRAQRIEARLEKKIAS
jgi:chemotaxis protein methyltransferase WspC